MGIKTPTAEQKLVIDYNGNIVVTAKPGSGKTYTLVEKIATIVPTLPDYRGIIAISFTNKASDELKDRCKRKSVSSNASFFGTIDKFCLSQIIIPFACHITKTLPDYRIVKISEAADEYYSLSEVNACFSQEQKGLILKALKEGIIFLELIGETAVLILSEVPGAILYLKAKYSHIIIDEYQDCGATQHSIFMTLVENGLTGIAVGDINQAIYGFSNRFPDYLISLLKNHSFKHFELTRNHRCHPAISNYSLALFGAFRDVPQEKRVFKVSISGGEEDIARRIEHYLPEIKKKYGIQYNNQIGILCRNNSTVSRIDSALHIPHKVYVDSPLDTDNSEWGRLFRETLYARSDPLISIADYAEQFFYEDYEPEKYRAALRICQDIFYNDPSETSFIEFASLVYPKKENNQSITLLKTVIESPYLLNSFSPAAPNEVNVLTLHKSKGLEYGIVFHLDLYRWILPFEQTDISEYRQSLNLHYVGVTRAIEACYIIEGTKRFRKKYNDYIPAEESPFLHLPGLRERRRDVTW